MKYHTYRSTLICVVASLCLGAAANAVSVLINNPSFETPVVDDSGNGGSVLAPHPSGTFNSWGYIMTTGSSFQDFGIENPGGGAYTGAAGTGTPAGADGTNAVFLNQGIVGGVINIFQDVGTLQANTTYTLTVAIGQRLDRVNGSPTIGLINAASGQTDAWANGTLLNSTQAVSNVNGAFQDFTVTFTTGATVTNDLYVGAQYIGDGTVQASVDNFRLTAIPEPTAVCLALLGGVALLRRRRR
jgi:uncharacterized protein (TIGR03382 family)